MDQLTVDVFDAQPVNPRLGRHDIHGEAGREIRGDFGGNGKRGRRSDKCQGGGGKGG